MQNPSPSPFSQQQQQQQQQQQGNFGSQMSPATPQQNQQSGMAGQMAFNQQYGMNQNMAMQGMQNAMSGQMSNMAGQMNNAAQRQYQMRLLQQQAALRQNGMAPQRPISGQQNATFNPAGQQQQQQQQQQHLGGQISNAQQGGQFTQSQMQVHMKRQAFLKQCAMNAQAAGRPFNPNPVLNGRPVDLWNLFSTVIAVGGSANADRNGLWQTVANKLGFSQPQFPTGPEEMKQIHAMNVSSYERVWLQAKNQQKQEQARVHAQQMAGLRPPAQQQQQQQGSPAKMMQPPPPQQQQSQYNPFQQSQQQQGQTKQPQATPVQMHAQLPQNGLSTHQQQQQILGGAGTIAHRRNSSSLMRKATDPTTPGPGAPAALPASSPHQHQQQIIHRSPSLRRESAPGPVAMRTDEPQTPNYVPVKRTVDWDGGYDVPALFELGNTLSHVIPNVPAVAEMGLVDTHCLTLSIASGLGAEVRYALDTLGMISNNVHVPFELNKCETLFEAIVDLMEAEVEALAGGAVEVSDALDLPSYEDVMRAARAEAETLLDIPEYGTPCYELDRAADRLVACTTILRNFSFYEHNHRLLTSPQVVTWLSNTLRLLGTRNMLLRSWANVGDFYKDVVIFLSNVTQGVELCAAEEAGNVLSFLLAFAPQPSPSYNDLRRGGAGGKGDEGNGRLHFPAFVPTTHRYLPPAVDCLAKLLARQDPNRVLYRQIFTASPNSAGSSDPAFDLLTKAFALAISVLPLPDRGPRGSGGGAGGGGQMKQLRVVEARKAFLTQGVLAADILASLIPAGPEGERLARGWLDSEDGWVGGLLSLGSLLAVDWEGGAGRFEGSGRRGVNGEPVGWDTESFRLITRRGLGMLGRIMGRGGRGVGLEGRGAGQDDAGVRTTLCQAEDGGDGPEVSKWEGVPQRHALIGALMLASTDHVALGLLQGLFDMAVAG